MASRCPGALQWAHVAAFALAITMNALSTAGQASVPWLYPKSNSQITAERPTAFTPAGFAFSIWGLIYLFGAAFIIFQALPKNADWTRRTIGPWMIINLVSNAAWLPVFQNEVGDLWPSVAVIAGGILLPLCVLHVKLHRPAKFEAASWGEYVCLYPFVSVYMGWVTVATVANVCLALTPPLTVVDDLAGWSADRWSVTLMCVAALLAAVTLATTRGRDFWYPLPIAWALAAIGVRQRSPDYPGGPMVVQAAFTLSALVGAMALVAAVRQAVLVRRRVAAKRAGQKQGGPAGEWAAPAGPAVVVGNPAAFAAPAGSAATYAAAGAQPPASSWN